MVGELAEMSAGVAFTAERDQVRQAICPVPLVVDIKNETVSRPSPAVLASMGISSEYARAIFKLTRSHRCGTSK